jgi:PAS domain S-box-containing protein
MISDRDNLSKTIRIDLIPDVPVAPSSGRKRVVIAASGEERVEEQGVARDNEAASEYEQLLQSLYDAALITDLDGNIVEANARAIEFFGYDAESFTSLTIFEVVSGADESLIDDLCENLENERFTLIQAYCLREDGSYFPSEIAVNRLSLDEERLCFFVRDITVRRQAEEMLRTEHNAIQNAGNGIAVVGLDGQFEFVNPAVASMWGYDSPDAVQQLSVAHLMESRQAVREMFEAIGDRRENWVGELPAKRADGSVFHVQVSAARNRNSEGETVGYVLSLVDIEDRKRAVEAERKADRQRVMLESLGAACHHLGQPATVLLANLGIIQKRLADACPDDRTRELLDSSVSAVNTLGGILRKLNAVNEYKTTQYLAPSEESEAESRILDI